MAKKSWFGLLKKLFISESLLNRDKKQKRRRWMFFGKFKIKRLPSISAASPSRDRTVLSETEQNNHDSGAAIFTTPAADEINATDIDQRPVTPQYIYQIEEENREFSPINVQYYAPPSTPQPVYEIAATKIQTAFRGYLARKALWALKGIVRFQAIIRGTLVRRQAITTLNRLQSVVNIQSQVCAKRSQMADGSPCSQGKKDLQEFRGKDIKIDINSQRRWDDSLLTREEEHALCSSKRMAAIKRERIKDYSFSNRRSAELEQNKEDGRWRYWLEQWVDTRLAKREDLENLISVFSIERNGEESATRQFKSKKLHKQYHNDGLDSSPKVKPFQHRKQRSVGDGNCAGGGGGRSPGVPTYMAATASAKAKVRSMSSPRLRPMNFDAQSETSSPFKHKLSPISSINSEVTTISMLAHPSSGFIQRSPCSKWPIKSTRSSKYFGVD